MKAASASCNYYYFHVRQKQRTTLLTQQQQQRHHQHHHHHRKDVRTYAEGKSKRRNGFAQELLRKEEEEEKDEEFKNNTRTQETERCVCGATSSYSNCCKQFHDGTYPNDPVTLMRSRFSAYVKGKAKYIVETTHSDNQIKKDGTKTSDGIVVSTLEADVRATCEKIEFYNLSIKNDKKKSETEHFVAFEYKCRVRGQKGFDRGREESHTELSTFRIGEDGKWYFLDGIQGA